MLSTRTSPSSFLPVECLFLPPRSFRGPEVPLVGFLDLKPVSVSFGFWGVWILVKSRHPNTPNPVYCYMFQIVMKSDIAKDRTCPNNNRSRAQSRFSKNLLLNNCVVQPITGQDTPEGTCHWVSSNYFAAVPTCPLWALKSTFAWIINRWSHCIHSINRKRRYPDKTPVAEHGNPLFCSHPSPVI